MKSLSMAQRVNKLVLLTGLMLGQVATNDLVAEPAIPLPLEFKRGSVEFNYMDEVFLKSAARRITQPGVPEHVIVTCIAARDDARRTVTRAAYDLCRARADYVASLLQTFSNVPKDRFESVVENANDEWGSDVMTVAAHYPGTAERGAPRRTDPPRPRRLLSMAFNNTDIAEVFQMLSREQRLNILLADGVTGTVSVNLYDVDTEQAVIAIADTAGFAVEKRNNAYFILKRGDAGRYAAGGITTVRTFKLHYSDPQMVANTLTKHLSNYGKVTMLPDRKQIVVEDTSDFMARIEKLLAEIDVQPAQFLIEAKILEITLNKAETFGIDWSKVLDYDDGSVSIGTPGTASLSTSDLVKRIGGALVFGMVSPDLRIFLKALGDEGRVRTLSTPKLLTLEDQQADVLVGNRIGYRTTVTINQVTTENIEFLESGVKLNVTPTMVEQGKILLKIHPEVSAGFLTAGESQLPQQNTTAVTTQLVAADGQTVFIGGLIKDEENRGRTGIPGLSDLPVLGRVFSSSDDRSTSTETIVLITPHLIKQRGAKIYDPEVAKVDTIESERR